MKKNVVLSTGVLGWIFSGLYCSVWSDWLEDFYCDLESEEEEYIAQAKDCIENKSWDMDKILRDIPEHLIGELSNQSYLDWIVFDGDVIEVHSPKYYNFSTDVFTFNVTVNLTEMQEYLINIVKNDFDAIKEFHNPNWKSCSGFISSMPTLDEINELIFMNPSKLSDDDISILTSLALEMARMIDGEFGDFEVNAWENWIGNNSNYEYYK